jgi:acyl carrier protein
VSDGERITKLVAGALGVPASAVGEATTSQDLEAWDSLGQLRILMALEDELGVAIDIETAAELDSIAKLLAWLKTV